MEQHRAGKNLDSLTALRGLAALMVVHHHAAKLWVVPGGIKALSDLGYLGVPFFFCLSGFVLQWSYGGMPVHAGSFLWRRIARIYPLMLLCTLASYGAYRLLGYPLAGVIGGRYSLLTSALLIQSWWSTPSIRGAWDSVSWSLSCEFFLYALSPFTIPAIARMKTETAVKILVVILPAILTLGISGFAGRHPYLFLLSPLGRLPGYLCGVSRQLSNWSPVLIFFIGIVLPLWVAAGPLGSVSIAVFEALVVPGFLLLIAVAAARDLSGGVRHWLCGDVLQFLGRISFSLYLVHPFVIGAAITLLWLSDREIAAPWFGEVFTFVCIGVTIGISACTYYWIEKPAQRFLLKTRFIDRQALVTAE